MVSRCERAALGAMKYQANVALSSADFDRRPRSAVPWVFISYLNRVQNDIVVARLGERGTLSDTRSC